MDFSFIILTFALLLLIAFLYSSVGHAGASGYLAVLALLSFPLESIKPTSLVLNIVVSLIASYKFISAGYFNRKVFLSFALTSIPFAFVGGYLKIEPYWFKIFAGFFLLSSATLLLVKAYIKPRIELAPVNIYFAATIGAVIGLISGLLGVGGGIFLSPLIILLGYANIKDASGIAALFILCNSILGLAGHYLSLQTLDTSVVLWILAVAIGGYIGSHFGSKKFNNKFIVLFLFIVLVTAGLKFIIVG
jgi:uncharacterized protein